MAKNQLSARQDLITREFFQEVATQGNTLNGSPAHKRQLIAILLEMLDYDILPNGAFIKKGTKVQMEYGSKDYSAYPNEWDTDEERSREAIKDQDTPETSASVKAESAPVREGILPEDVQ